MGCGVVASALQCRDEFIDVAVRDEDSLRSRGGDGCQELVMVGVVREREAPVNSPSSRAFG